MTWRFLAARRVYPGGGKRCVIEPAYIGMRVIYVLLQSFGKTKLILHPLAVVLHKPSPNFLHHRRKAGGIALLAKSFYQQDLVAIKTFGILCGKVELEFATSAVLVGPGLPDPMDEISAAFDEIIA